MPQDKIYADRWIDSSKTESIDSMRGKITQIQIDFVVSKILANQMFQLEVGIKL